MLVYYLISLVILLIDQWTKHLTVQNIPLYSTKEFLPGFLSFTYIQNTGAAYSILEGKMVFFYIVTIMVVGAIVYSLQKYGKKQPLFSVALAFILGGALGNFIDRILFQFVIDMIKLEFVSFPIFNIADAALTVGVLLMILHIFMEEKQEKKSKEEHNQNG